jgi:hypothetical protein
MAAVEAAATEVNNKNSRFYCHADAADLALKQQHQPKKLQNLLLKKQLNQHLLLHQKKVLD